MKQIHILHKQVIRLIDNLKAMSHSDLLFLKYKILKIIDLSLTKLYLCINIQINFIKTCFKQLGNFERSLNYQLDILNMNLLQYLPSSSLLKMGKLQFLICMTDLS